MQDPDPKCRHFVISWHFMAFWHVCQKANCITKSAFSAFSRLFPPFCLFHRIRLLDFSALTPTFPWRTIEIPSLQFKCCWSEPEVGLSGRNWPKVALSGRNWFLQRMQLRGWQTECYLLHQVEPIFTFPYSYLYLLSHLIYVFVTCYFLWCMFVFAIFNVWEISSDLYRYHVVTF